MKFIIISFKSNEGVTNWAADSGCDRAQKVARRRLWKSESVSTINGIPMPASGRVWETSRQSRWWSCRWQQRQPRRAGILPKSRQCPATTTTVGGQSCPARVPSGRVDNIGLSGGDGSGHWVNYLLELVLKGSGQKILEGHQQQFRRRQWPQSVAFSLLWHSDLNCGRNTGGGGPDGEDNGGAPTGAVIWAATSRRNSRRAGQL